MNVSGALFTPTFSGRGCAWKSLPEKVGVNNVPETFSPLESYAVVHTEEHRGNIALYQNGIPNAAFSRNVDLPYVNISREQNEINQLRENVYSEIWKNDSCPFHYCNYFAVIFKKIKQRFIHINGQHVNIP